MIGITKQERGIRAWIRSFHFHSTWQNYLMLAVPAMMVFLFSYIPLFGLLMAFEDYNPAKGIFGSPFVGLKWFRVAMEMPDFWKVVRNTLSISLGKIVFCQLFSIVFAILLNEVRRKGAKRLVQTVTYFPHFLSWVVMGGVFTELLGNKGMINLFIRLLGGKSIFFLGNYQYFQGTMIALHVWKEFGWGAIVYLAAMTNINPELYEAATIDGANRFKQTWHVTLPGISVTIVMMVVLALGTIMSAGFDQMLIMYNPAVYETGDIIDTFVYRQGLLESQYSMATAIGLFKSVIGAALMIITNALATRYCDYRIF